MQLDSLNFMDKPLVVVTPDNEYEEVVETIERAQELIEGLYLQTLEDVDNMPPGLFAVLEHLSIVKRTFQLMNTDRLGEDWKYE